MPVDLNRLTAGWLQLESDPGLFTLLLEDFGVKGVQVEEIYDLQKSMEGPVYGFIFLFKWIEERRSRRKVVVPDESFVEEEDTVNSIFFAQQMVPNSCATHALLSVLLNCSKIHLGPTLTRLKEYTKNMSPENKGYAIGNTPELARAHNSHAKPEPFHRQEKSHGISTGRTMEAFHFVSYVPINGRLFELDGLKPYPIDHGPWAEVEDWTEKFRRVITERLGIATGGEPYHDIRFNLMAVVPDRRMAYEQKLRTLKTNRQIVLEALQQLVKLTHPELTSDDHNACMAAVNKTKVENRHSEQQDEDTKDTVTSVQCHSDSSTPKLLQDSHPTLMPAPDSNPATPNSLIPKLPPALDNHNYAKSPMMEGLAKNAAESRPRYEEYSGSEYSEEDDADSQATKPKNVMSQSEPNSSEIAEDNDMPTENNEHSHMKPLTINTSSDLMKPLTIQTKFHPSPCPSASSTDTSSEAGSAFNSPVRYYSPMQNSPNSMSKIPGSRGSEINYFDDVRDIHQFVVIRVTSKSNKVIATGDSMLCENKSCSSSEVSKRVASSELPSGDAEPDAKRPYISDDTPEGLHGISDKGHGFCSSTSNNSENNKHIEVDQMNLANQESDSKNGSRHNISRHPHLTEPHKFAPKDLLALLKTVENEIKVYETNLRDEIEKRKKYKVDDCRRTHNYDQFICTFLSMLAEQGKLADLVEQQLLVRRRQGAGIGRLQKPNKPDRRRKSRPKKRK